MVSFCFLNIGLLFDVCLDLIGFDFVYKVDILYIFCNCKFNILMEMINWEIWVMILRIKILIIINIDVCIIFLGRI